MIRGEPKQPDSSRGILKNGNAPGDLSKALRCGARTRRGTSCQGPAMQNGRCRMHGGTSTGPRTPQGLERCRSANWKHGRYSATAIEQNREVRKMLRQMREDHLRLLEEMRSEEQLGLRSPLCMGSILPFFTRSPSPLVERSPEKAIHRTLSASFDGRSQ